VGTEPNLAIQVWGQVFKNPIVVASATPSKDAEHMRRCAEAGAGGIVAKTVTPEPALQRYVRPRFTVLHKKGWPHVFSNYSCEFLATYTPSEWKEQMAQAKRFCDDMGTVLIGSISGTTISQWKTLACIMEDLGISILELNFGCPHPRDLEYRSGAELGRDPEASAEVTWEVVSSVKIPVVVKVTAEAVDPVVVARKVKEAGASGITAINRFPALDVHLPSGRPLLHSTFAGVGGPWMRPIMLKWVAKIVRETGLPVSATNGIWTWRDVVKAIMCGAHTVQTCTALMYGTRGLTQIRDFVRGLEVFMAENGYRSVNEFRGLSLPQIKSWTEIEREQDLRSTVNLEKCNGCGLCVNWCYYGAITMISEPTPKASINESCDGCGLCAALCPRDAMAMVGESECFMGDLT